MTQINTNRWFCRRRGNIAALTALLLVPVLAVVALAIDVGVMQVHRAELQRSADAAAMAGVWELLETKHQDLNDPGQVTVRARTAARQYANANYRKPLQIDDRDIKVGFMPEPRSGGVIQLGDPKSFNAVQVRVRRDHTTNGPLHLILGSLIGTDSAATSATATAAMLADVKGFKVTDDFENLPLLPFALDLTTWESVSEGFGQDLWRWDANAEQFVPGSDGIPEFNFYPQDTGSAANRGTVNIGATNNSTRRVSRQILDGITVEDLKFHDGQLVIESGTITLGADPGISAGFKDELAKIIGQARLIPVFSELSGNGNNGVYTIVRWVGIRIIDVNLSGADKWLLAQASPVVVTGVVPGDDPGSHSEFIYSPVWIVE